MSNTSVAAPPVDGTTSLRASVSRTRLIFVLAGLMLGMLLASLDQTIVGTAMPRVIADLNGLEHYAWVFTAYMLASTVTVPIYGKMSDIYGHRPFFLLGMILFMLGSALSGMSQTMVQLVIFRGIQGLGAGAIMPLVMAIVGDIFPPAQRGKWQGMMTAVFGISAIFGPALGGWITDNVGWRWVFYVNMPVGLLAVLTTGLAMPKTSRRREHTIDYLGVATLIAGAVPLLLGFSWGGTQYAWSSPQIIGMLAFAVVMLGVFMVVETRAAEPIISPRLFQNNIFNISVAVSFLVAVGMFGTIMYLPLFVQGVLGNSATTSGTVLTPMMFGFIVSSIIGGQIIARTGKYKAVAITGFVLAIAGMFLLAQMSTATSNAVVVRNMIVTGLGIGVMMSLFTIVVQNAFPREQLGEVTAGLQFFRSIGATIGVAVLGTVLNSRFHSEFMNNLPAAVKQSIPADRLAALNNPQVLLAPQAQGQIRQAFASMGPAGQQVFEQVMRAIRLGLSTAITDLFRLSVGVMIAGLLLTLFLKEIPLRKTHSSTGLETAVPDGAAEVPGAPSPVPVTQPLAAGSTDRDGR